MTTAALLLALVGAAAALAPQPSAFRSHRTSPVPRAPLLVAEARWRAALPKRGELDREILGVTLPSIANLAVIPLVGAVDTFWIGRMGSALALAGQGAANQVFFSAYFLIAFIPTITAPLVARAAGSGDIDGACTRVCEALFLANVLGLIGTLVLVLRPSWALGLVLPAGAPAAEAATRYLRLRSISLVPALVSSIGFAAFRGLLDTVTPLKVSDSTAQPPPRDPARTECRPLRTRARWPCAFCPPWEGMRRTCTRRVARRSRSPPTRSTFSSTRSSSSAHAWASRAPRSRPPRPRSAPGCCTRSSCSSASCCASARHSAAPARPPPPPTTGSSARPRPRHRPLPLLVASRHRHARHPPVSATR
jgi:hypothetical protein